MISTLTTRRVMKLYETVIVKKGLKGIVLKVQKNINNTYTYEMALLTI